MISTKWWLFLMILGCQGARRPPRQKTLLVNNEMIYVGITNHYIHDVFDETMFYEFLESENALTKRNLENYINKTIGTVGKLSDQQFDMIVSKWIFQMLPSQ